MPRALQVSSKAASAACRAAVQKLSKGKASLALELVGYDADLTAAMQYVFGNSFICEVTHSSQQMALSRLYASFRAVMSPLHLHAQCTPRDCHSRVKWLLPGDLLSLAKSKASSRNTVNRAGQQFSKVTRLPQGRAHEMHNAPRRRLQSVRHPHR